MILLLFLIQLHCQLYWKRSITLPNAISYAIDFNYLKGITHLWLIAELDLHFSSVNCLRTSPTIFFFNFSFHYPWTEITRPPLRNLPVQHSAMLSDHFRIYHSPYKASLPLHSLLEKNFELFVHVTFLINNKKKGKNVFDKEYR